MTFIYLVRHAETEGMASKGIIKSDKFTLRGREQAKALAKRLAHIRFDTIYSSTQHRAHKTAKLIRAKHPKTPFVITDELKEIYAPIVGGPAKNGIPIERLSNDLARAERVYNRFFKLGKKHLLLVCHGNLIRYLIARSFRKNLRKVPLATFPTSVSIVWVKKFGKDKESFVFCVNDTNHLPQNLAKGYDFPSIKLL